MTGPAYLAAYLNDTSLNAIDECIVVESKDQSGLFVFNRFTHDTEVVQGDILTLAGISGSIPSES
jgi:hypothetical protein